MALENALDIPVTSNLPFHCALESSKKEIGMREGEGQTSYS